MLYNRERKEQIINSITTNWIDLACKQVKLAGLGFDKQSTLIGIQLNSMLLGAFENIDVFSKERQNSFEKLYSLIENYE